MLHVRRFLDGWGRAGDEVIGEGAHSLVMRRWLHGSAPRRAPPTAAACASASPSRPSARR
jgi:hypothetical protein